MNKLSHEVVTVAKFLASKVGRGTRAEKMEANQAFKDFAKIAGLPVDNLAKAIGADITLK